MLADRQTDDFRFYGVQPNGKVDTLDNVLFIDGPFVLGTHLLFCVGGFCSPLRCSGGATDVS